MYQPSTDKRSLPHAGGGVSRSSAGGCAVRQSSPRRWGCFLKVIEGTLWNVVFPTQVGVFLGFCSKGTSKWCLPHAGGGVSAIPKLGTPRRRSSPRRWGCFQIIAKAATDGEVFPTQVGVFPLSACCSVLCLCLPHAGGGVSH